MAEWENAGFAENDGGGYKTLSAVRMELKDSDVVSYYGQNGVCSVRDVIIAVRKVYENPYQKVILVTSMELPAEELERVLIYIEGVNDSAVNELRGVQDGGFCVAPINEETSKLPAFGIPEVINRFKLTYNVDRFEVLTYGDSPDLLYQAWTALRQYDAIAKYVRFPITLNTRLSLWEDGFDISEYAERLHESDERNELSLEVLLKVTEDVRNVVRSGKRSIQNFESSRSLYSKWLTMCVTQEMNLAPVYITSYLAEYVDLEIAYPFEKLSCCERLQFVLNLPEHVGYIAQHSGFCCRFDIKTKIFPNPTLAFNMRTGEVIRTGLDDFAVGKINMQDFRGMFPSSKRYYNVDPKGATGLIVANQDDYTVDQQLSKIFAEMTKAANEEDVFVNVHNSVIGLKDGVPYVVYFSEPCGLRGILQSDLFGAHVITLGEEHFKHLVDVKVILAMDHQRQYGNTKDNSEFKQIMVQAKKTFTPAIPTFVLMCASLGGVVSRGLSYYDQRLRCDKRIVPIVTHIDSVLRERSIFDLLNYNTVREDKIATSFISAFGTIYSDSRRTQRLPVSIDSFKGVKLL